MPRAYPETLRCKPRPRPSGRVASLDAEGATSWPPFLSVVSRRCYTRRRAKRSPEAPVRRTPTTTAADAKSSAMRESCSAIGPGPGAGLRRSSVVVPERGESGVLSDHPQDEHGADRPLTRHQVRGALCGERGRPGKHLLERRLVRRRGARDRCGEELRPLRPTSSPTLSDRHGG